MMVRKALFFIALLLSPSGVLQDQRRKHGFHSCAEILATQIYNKDVVPTDLLSLQRSVGFTLNTDAIKIRFDELKAGVKARTRGNSQELREAFHAFVHMGAVKNLADLTNGSHGECLWSLGQCRRGTGNDDQDSRRQYLSHGV